MHPIFFSLGPLEIHTYGVMLSLGFLAGVYMTSWLAKRSGLDPEKMVNLAFWLLLGGLFGSRLLFVITEWEYFSNHFFEIFNPRSGLVFYGALLFDVPFAVWYMRRHQFPVWKTLDVLLPGVAIGQSLGRLGCLAAGCCYGRPTHSEWGVKLTSDLVAPELRGIYLHPTQIYEATSMLIVFFGLLWVFKKKKFDGQVALTYFMTYPIVRSIIEIYRGDFERGYVIQDWITTSQFISIMIFPIALGFMIYRLRQTQAGTLPTQR